MSRITLEQIRIKDGFFYLASPYSKWPTGIEDAFKAVAEVAGRLIERGVFVYSPIAHTHPISIHAAMDPMSHTLWLPADKAIADKAFGLIVAAFPGWRDSYGIGEEIKWFGETKRPRFILDPLRLDVVPFA